MDESIAIEDNFRYQFNAKNFVTIQPTITSIYTCIRRGFA